MHRFQILFFMVVLVLPLFAQQKSQEVPFTLADRDRILRTEQKIESLTKSVDERFESLTKSVDERFESLTKSVDERFEFVQKQLDNIFNLMLFLLGGIMGLIGFVIYDRRTLLKPVSRKQQEIEKALIAYSKKNKEFKEILQKTGIL